MKTRISIVVALAALAMSASAWARDADQKADSIMSELMQARNSDTSVQLITMPLLPSTQRPKLIGAAPDGLRIELRAMQKADQDKQNRSVWPCVNAPTDNILVPVGSRDVGEQ